MLHKKEFDLTEAVVLLNIYLKSKDWGITTSAASKEASAILRAMAVNSGYEINEKFRSVAGVQNRFRLMASMYEGGDNSDSSGPYVFRKAIQLYRDNDKKYFEILETAAQLLPAKKDWFEQLSKKYSTMENIETTKKKESNKDAFFEWLSTAVSSEIVDKIKDSYKIVTTILLQKQVLNESLFLINDTTQIRKALSQTTSAFANKKMRVITNLLLSQYINFLEAKSEISVEILSENLVNKTPNNWVLYDFTNEKDFVGTVPIQCTLQGKTLEGKTWAQILVSIVNDEIEKGNPAIADLYVNTLPGGRSDSPFLMKDKIRGLTCKQLKNRYWININYSLPQIMKIIKEVCFHCGYNENQMVFYGCSKKANLNTQKSGDNKIPDEVIEAIRRLYGKGLRFEETVIHLLEQETSTKIDISMQNALKNCMFHRKDEVYFLPDMMSNHSQLKLLEVDNLKKELSQCGCIDIEALYIQYSNLGDTIYLRDKSDFEDYVAFFSKNEFRFSNTLKTRIIRKASVTVANALSTATKQIVSTIERVGCVTLDDLQIEYPLFTAEFIRLLLEKYSNTIMSTVINDFVCYQTVESMNFGDEFSSILGECLNEIEKLSLQPSQDVIHAILSIKLGYNLRDEYGITDDKTFRHIISIYYDGNRTREWKSGSFVEVNGTNV